MFLRSDIRSDAQATTLELIIWATLHRLRMWSSSLPRSERKEIETTSSCEVFVIEANAVISGWDMMRRMWDDDSIWLVEIFHNHKECARNCVERDGIRTLSWTWMTEPRQCLMLVSLLLNNAEPRQCRQPDIHSHSQRSCRRKKITWGDMPHTKREHDDHSIRKEKAKDAKCE